MIKILIALATLLITFLFLCFIRSAGLMNQYYDQLVYERFFREDGQADEGCTKDIVKGVS